MTTNTKEPGQLAYEAYAEALRSKSFYITPWEKLEGCSRYGWAEAEAAIRKRVHHQHVSDSDGHCGVCGIAPGEDDEHFEWDKRLDDCLNTVIAALRGTEAARLLTDTVGGGIERLRFYRDKAERALGQSEASAALADAMGLTADHPQRGNLSWLVGVAVTRMEAGQSEAWVSVGERLPEFEREVLLYYRLAPGNGRDGRVVGRRSRRHTGGFYWYSPAFPPLLDEHIVAWAPLPSPPKSSEGGAL